MKRGLFSYILCLCYTLSILGQEGYPAIDNDYVPTTHQINTQKKVGQIDITSGISPSGARTYTVPIAVYDGIRKFNPELSLVYNSQQGNGLLGMGWSISGLSTICRTIRTPHYDGKIAHIAFNRDDAFMLNGMRLVKVDSVTYLSEHGYIRAKANYSGNSLQYFDVSYPNGRTAIFGYKTNTTNNLYYPLTELSDLWGNTITYHYTPKENHYQINKITYNGASIEFSFSKTRIDPVSFYISGKKVTENSLLNSITCKFGNTVLGIYKFSYKNEKLLKLKQSLLEKIEYLSGTESFPPLHFYYGKGNDAIGYDTQTSVCSGFVSNPSQNRSVIARNATNSWTDLIVEVPNYNPYVIQVEGDSWIENGYPNNANVYYLYPQDTQIEQRQLINCGNGFIDILAADITGSGRDRIIQINNTVVNKNTDQVTFTIYNGEYPVISGQPLQHTYKFSTLHSSIYGNGIQPKYYYPGDFNGDGKTEILAVSAHQPFGDTNLPSKCYVFELNKGTLPYQGHIFPFHVEFQTSKNPPTPEQIYNRTDKIFVLDYDGDGCSEFIYQSKNKAQVYKFDITGSTWTPRKIAEDAPFTFTNNTKILTGDFNGDGMTDVFQYYIKTPNRQPCALFISLGNGKFDLQRFDLPLREGESLGQEHKYNYLLQDVNGDGRSDLIDYTDKGFYTYLYNNSERFEEPFFTAYPSSGGKLLPSRLKMNGDFSKLAYLNGKNIPLYSFSRNDKKEHLITGMVNSFGAIEKNDYAIMNGDAVFSSVYNCSFRAHYPYAPAFDNLPLLAISEKYVNGKQIDGQHYYYDRGAKHLTGKGFCGFEETRIVDFKGKELIRNFEPERYGVQTYEAYDWAYTHNYDYEVIEHPNHMVEINLRWKDEMDNLKNMFKEYTYDNFKLGYPSTEEILYNGQSTKKTETIYRPVYTGWAKNKMLDTSDVCAMLAYIPSGMEYIFGRIDEQTVKNTTEDGKSLSKRTTFPSWQYDVPTARRDYLGEETRYDNQYDTKGNLTKTVTSWLGGQKSISESWEYDDYGRVSSHTSNIGTKELYTYGTDGRLKSHTDSRGNATLFTYDGFGRQTGITNPDGTTVTTEYIWCNEVEGGVYATIIKETGKPDTKTVYDALGRIVRQSEMTYDGKWRNTDTQYDIYGRISKKSLPDTKNSPSTYISYTYDEFDRLISVTDHPDHTTTYTYNDDFDGYTVTTTQDGVETTRAYDPHDRLIRVSDPGGTTSYELDADGQPLTITTPDGAQTTFEYNSIRKCSKKTDLGFGETSYGYTYFGEIASETNAKGEIVSRIYDQYNRLTHIGWGSPDVTYTYTPHGEISTIKGTNNTLLAYTYDEFGRMTSLQENAPDGKWLRKDYTYKDGNTASTTYTSQNGQIATENYFYKNGHLTEIKLDNGTSIFKLESENSMGLPTKVQTGNITRLYEYDSYGYPLRRTGKTDQLTYQDFTYTFDAPRKNLKARTDQRLENTENFNYDDMNRLTGDGRYNILEYAPNGNIAKKSGVGSYSYNVSGKPHAVSGITLDGNLPAGLGTQEIFYTKALRPDSIHDGTFDAKFAYNGNLDKVKMTVTQNKGRSYSYLRKYYLGGCYELEESSLGPTKERLYLGGNYYDAPVYREKFGPMSQDYNLLRDYLGSITHVVRFDGYRTDESSYDAWGRRRNPSSYYPEAQQTSLSVSAFSRGFCGHEHLGTFGLIDMNARLYTPILGRFLSPDPYIQFPDFSQGFNRYAYCMNNPLVYVDENGKELVSLALGLAAFLGGTANLTYKVLKDQIGGFRDAVYAFGIGAGAGVAGAAVGIVASPILGAGFLGGFATGALSGVASSAFLSVGNSQAFGDPRMGWKDYLLSAAGAGVIGGLVSGGVAAYQGKNFWTGKTIQSNSISLQEQSLIHYTSKENYENIISSGKLNPSTDPKHARFGSGQYLTDLKPEDYTAGQISRRLYGVPWNTKKLEYYIEINTSGLNIQSNIPHNFLVPNNKPLNISNRIVNKGKSFFKP